MVDGDAHIKLHVTESIHRTNNSERVRSGQIPSTGLSLFWIFFPFKKKPLPRNTPRLRKKMVILTFFVYFPSLATFTFSSMKYLGNR